MAIIKIKLSDTENYSIDIPETLDKNKLDYVTGRFIFLQKMIGRDPLQEATTQIVQTNNDPSIPRTRKVYQKSGISWKILNKNRELSLEFVRLFYLEDDKQKILDFLEKHNICKVSDVPSITYLNHATKCKAYSLRVSFKFTPQEVGLTRFPGSGDQHIIKTLRL